MILIKAIFMFRESVAITYPDIRLHFASNGVHVPIFTPPALSRAEVEDPYRVAMRSRGIERVGTYYGVFLI